ncbi:MAG TPA: hypothetical protein PK794_06395, partial [Armatimonadota bacterium]|nr:hypothetical protein [Armatimonadota bacterium]
MPTPQQHTMTEPLDVCLRRAGSTYQPAAPEDLPRVIAAFNAFAGEVEATADGCEIVRIVAGHINTTFGLRQTAGGLAYIVQRMNTIFDLDAIAGNLRLLEEAQAASAALLPDHWQPVSYLNARDTGAKLWFDAAGAGWRVMRYVPGEIRIFNHFGMVPAEMTAAVARSQGEAIAIFGRMLEAIPEERWRAPLPHFHNT